MRADPDLHARLERAGSHIDVDAHRRLAEIHAVAERRSRTSRNRALAVAAVVGHPRRARGVAASLLGGSSPRARRDGRTQRADRLPGGVRRVARPVRPRCFRWREPTALRREGDRALGSVVPRRLAARPHPRAGRIRLRGRRRRRGWERPRHDRREGRHGSRRPRPPHTRVVPGRFPDRVRGPDATARCREPHDLRRGRRRERSPDGARRALGRRVLVPRRSASGVGRVPRSQGSDVRPLHERPRRIEPRATHGRRVDRAHAFLVAGRQPDRLQQRVRSRHLRDRCRRLRRSRGSRTAVGGTSCRSGRPMARGSPSRATAARRPSSRRRTDPATTSPGSRST